MFSRWKRTPPEGEEVDPQMGRRNSEQKPGIFNRSSRRLSMGVRGTDKTSRVSGTGARQPLKSRKEILLEVDQERKERLQLQKQVFGEQWLDDCYGRVVYPNPACVEVGRGRLLWQGCLPQPCVCGGLSTPTLRVWRWVEVDWLVDCYMAGLSTPTLRVWKWVGVDWLVGCYGKVKRRIKLMERVSRALAKRIVAPQESEQKQQALFYLLGPEYTEQYFPRSTYRVDILEPPKMLPARKEKYLEEMTEFLKTSLDETMNDCGFPRLYNEHSVDDELYRYLLAARSVFRQGLEKRAQQEELKSSSRSRDAEASLLQLVEEGGPHTRVFPPEVLDKNPSAAAKLYSQLQQLPASAELQGSQLQLLTDPAIFVRKWIAQAFMGVLSVSASMWVWDQLMIGDWSPDTFITMSTAILSLLRPWMLRASKYSGAKKVLLQEPGKIYTSDLRDVYTHLMNKRQLVEAPPNSNYIGPPSPPAIQLLDENGKRSPVQSDETRMRRQNSTVNQGRFRRPSGDTSSTVVSPQDVSKTVEKKAASNERKKNSPRSASKTSDRQKDNSKQPRVFLFFPAYLIPPSMDVDHSSLAAYSCELTPPLWLPIPVN
ncbi:Rab-GTPase-TBC domain [Trinorchestia longiramus]|nr:Rab-GTPase-TBC domain [Trinorchestia longiramus]